MRRVIVMLAPVLLFASLVMAGVPRLINYQGILTETNGTPVTGTHDLTFTIYPDSGVYALPYWSEMHSAVEIENGLYNVILGGTTFIPDTLLQAEERWIGITVDTDPEIRPRMRITAVPWAMRAAVAETVINGGGSDGDWTISGNDIVSAVPGNVGIGVTPPLAKLHVGGSTTIGSGTADGTLELRRSGTANAVMEASSSADGGQLVWYDESGNGTTAIRPDADGTGGYLDMKRNETATGFRVDANYAGTRQPHVEILGDSMMVAFRLDTFGDGGVILTNNAISNAEILDEPGVASEVSGGSISLNGTVQTLLSRSITVPADGYVLAIGTCQPLAYHASGTSSLANFGVSQSSSGFPGNQDVAWGIADGAGSGTYHSAVTVHGLFDVSSGTQTFYFLARLSYGSITVHDMQFTLVYIPTAYGTVTSTLQYGEEISDADAPGVLSKSETDIAVERAESQAANNARIERELAAMRAELEALKRELRNKGE